MRHALPSAKTQHNPNKRNQRATDRLWLLEGWMLLCLYGKLEIIALAKTKKVGSTGRFGPRYGAKLRRRVLDIEGRRHEPHRCPSCATRALHRVAAGLWKCKKCDLLFAGGAYVPYTDAGKAAKRAIAQRIAGDFLALRDEEEIEEVLDFLPNIEPTEETVESEEAVQPSDDEPDEEN